MKKYLPYLILPYIVYWTSEFYILGTWLSLWSYDELSAKGYFVSGLICFNPVTLFLTSVVFGYRRGFSVIFPILISVGFFIYNLYVNIFYFVAFTLFYEIAYAIISIFGILLGMGLKKLLKTVQNA